MAFFSALLGARYPQSLGIAQPAAELLPCAYKEYFLYSGTAKARAFPPGASLAPAATSPALFRFPFGQWTDHGTQPIAYRVKTSGGHPGLPDRTPGPGGPIADRNDVGARR